MGFVWFWTFWHWSKESYRTGVLLRGPLQGIGGHWDEWFHHEAGAEDLQAIAETGRTESSQRQFIAWLHLHWSPEANGRGNRLIPRFVLSQLAHVAPFGNWCAMGDFRDSYGVGGVPAIILAEKSSGQPEDVRPLEGLVLPLGIGSKVFSEGFHANPEDLETPLHAARNSLAGTGFWLFIALWIAGGERPYPRWLKGALALGWMGVGALMLHLRCGPEPGEFLFGLAAVMIGLWCALVAVAVAVIAQQTILAWRQGKRWCERLDQSEIRLRMNGGLTVKGGSAGLPFCLNTLLALSRAAPPSDCSSWIWQQLFRRMRSEAESWAATGVVHHDGWIKPVVIEPKLRACLQRGGIHQVLTPRQPEANRKVIARLAGTLPAAAGIPPKGLGAGAANLGFASEQHTLAIHPCGHLAQALMTLGGLSCPGQRALTLFAAALSGVMLWAFPDLRGILMPPAAPEVVAPSSPSPYYLWVSLDTVHPRDFQVVLESQYWSNRRAPVARYSGANGSVRAQISLHRLAGQDASDGENGTLWIERRLHFLGREYAPGERVGRYTLAYLNRLPP